MKFTVGYSQNEFFKRAVLRNLEKISEIYFPWGSFTTGRGTPPNAQFQRTMEVDLEEFVQVGLKMNLLLNGNCYGRHSQARAFYQSIGDTAEEISERFALDSITTTSPLIAKFFKTNFPNIEVRASVNMEISNAESMAYLADVFDGFYVKREFNYDISKLSQMRKWTLENNKKLYILANSGCLNFCPARTFHDNLVAHQHEIAEMDNAYEFKGLCSEFLKNEDARCDLLHRLNFIRPEDLPLYSDLCDGIKLATRTNRNPSSVIEAYCAGAFSGNALELTEPSHAGHLYPNIISNSKIPSDYAKKRLSCDKNCNECGYCKSVQKLSTINLNQTTQGII